MEYRKITMSARKNIALVAHDNKKHDLFEWAKFNRELLAQPHHYARVSVVISTSAPRVPKATLIS